MRNFEVKSFDKPDETREFAGNGMVDVAYVGGKPVGRGTFEPGWKWSTNVKPLAGTDSCQMHHLGYVMHGKMRIHMNDGSELDIVEGEVVSIAPGHDAEVLGDEPCVLVDFGDVADYARQATT